MAKEDADADADEGTTTGRKPRHRISNVNTREVSLVDRGANKRRLLIVKREEDDMSGKGAEVGPDGKIINKDADKGEPPTDVLKLDAEIKKSLGESLGAIRDGFAALAESVAKAEDLEGAQPPEGFFGDLTESITKAVDALPGLDGDVLLEKVGRKMSGARLKRLMAAANTIRALVKELAGQTDDDANDAKRQAAAKAEGEQLTAFIAKAIEDGLEQGLAPVVETMGALKTEAVEQRKRLDEVAKRTPGSQALDGDPPPKKPAATDAKKVPTNRLDPEGRKGVPASRSFD